MSLTLITACMHCAVVSISFCSDSFSSSVASIFHQDWWWKLMVTEWKELETLSSHELAPTDSRPESLRCAEEVSAQWSDSPIINTRSCWKINATRQHGNTVFSPGRVRVNEAVNDFVLLRLYLAQNVIHKFQKDFINIEIILGTRFAVAHSTYSRGKLQEKKYSKINTFRKKTKVALWKNIQSLSTRWQIIYW